MTNNGTKDQILDLFPDNNEYEISARDMRTYIEAIFGDKEVQVIKIASASDIPFNNEHIYEGSLVVIYRGGDIETGLYISTINQPLDITQLIKVAGLGGGGSSLPPGQDGDILIYKDGSWIASEKLSNIQSKTELIDLYKEAENNYFKEILYNTEGNITQINIYQDNTKNVKFFTKDITYDTEGNITQVIVENIPSSETMTKNISYDAEGNIIETSMSFS